MKSEFDLFGIDVFDIGLDMELEQTMNTEIEASDSEVGENAL